MSVDRGISSVVELWFSKPMVVGSTPSFRFPVAATQLGSPWQSSASAEKIGGSRSFLTARKVRAYPSFISPSQVDFGGYGQKGFALQRFLPRPSSALGSIPGLAMFGCKPRLRTWSSCQASESGVMGRADACSVGGVVAES